VSASWASQSLSSSYALTASYFSNISGSNNLYLQSTDGNTYNVTLATAGGYTTLVIGQTPITGTNAFVTVGIPSASASYAATASYVSGSGGAWGAIKGTISNQTDLQNQLNVLFSLAMIGV
jgi:hypothetical protein